MLAINIMFCMLPFIHYHLNIHPEPNKFFHLIQIIHFTKIIVYYSMLPWPSTIKRRVVS